MSFNNVLMFGFGNCMWVISLALVFFVLWEYPTTTLVKRFLLPWLSTDEVVARYHSREKGDKETPFCESVIANEEPSGL